METLIKSDVFFFIATIGFVVVGTLTAIALVYIIRAGRNIYFISEDLRARYGDVKDIIVVLLDRLENNRIFSFLFPGVRAKTRSQKATIDRKKDG